MMFLRIAMTRVNHSQTRVSLGTVRTSQWVVIDSRLPITRTLVCAS
jgi:hypothetical protein